MTPSDIQYKKNLALELLGLLLLYNFTDGRVFIAADPVEQNIARSQGRRDHMPSKDQLKGTCSRPDRRNHHKYIFLDTKYH